MTSQIKTAGQDFLIEAGRVLTRPGLNDKQPVRIRELRAIVEALGHLLAAIGEDQTSLDREITAAQQQSAEILTMNQEILERLRVLDGPH
jgi:hypothetical protein